MNRTTLHFIRYQTRTPIVLGLCRDDPRVADFVNEAQMLLLDFGRWFGCVQRWRICAINACVTLPVQFASIERAALCHAPIPVHDIFFEFLDNGWGTAGAEGSCGNCGIGNGANYIGNFPTFDDIRGLNKKLNVTCDLPSDVGKQVKLLGYDENLNWIRTDQSGSIQDGELVSLAQSAGTDSTHLFSSMTDIQLPDNRDGQVWLYEKNTDDDVRRLISRYEYFEQSPSYPRYRVNGIPSGSSVTNGGCQKTLLEVVANLEFIPVKNDNDFLIVGNPTAIKEGCLAIKYGEKKEDVRDSESHLARALRALNNELDKHVGAGIRRGINVEGTGFGQPVESFM